MTALLIIACSATKRRDAGGLPAIDRYDGPAFRVLRRTLRERAGLGEALTIRILSAEFGLIAADTVIPYYDRRMTEGRAQELRPLVSAQLEALPMPAYIACGGVYRVALLPWLSKARVPSGGIGEQLGQLKRWLWGLPL